MSTDVSPGGYDATSDLTGMATETATAVASRSVAAAGMLPSPKPTAAKSRGGDRVIVCDRCGHENEAENRFCANCGNRLVKEAAAADAPAGAVPTSSWSPPEPRSSPEPAPRAPIPSPISPPPAFRSQTGGDSRELPPSHPEWRMSSAGPLPDPPRRRRWIWIVLGLLGACVIACVAIFIFFSTETGTRLLEDFEAQATTVQQTRDAGS